MRDWRVKERERGERYFFQSSISFTSFLWQRAWHESSERERKKEWVREARQRGESKGRTSSLIFPSFLVFRDTKFTLLANGTNSFLLTYSLWWVFLSLSYLSELFSLEREEDWIHLDSMRKRERELNYPSSYVPVGFRQMITFWSSCYWIPTSSLLPFFFTSHLKKYQLFPYEDDAGNGTRKDSHTVKKGRKIDNGRPNLVNRSVSA